MKKILIMMLLFTGIAQAQSFSFECSADNIEVINEFGDIPIDIDGTFLIRINLINLPDNHGLKIDGIWLDDSYLDFPTDKLSQSFTNTNASVPGGWSGKIRFKIVKEDVEITL